MNRVAIFLENFELGGRERVALKMSEVLNQLAIVPDIYAMRFAISAEDAGSAFKSSARFRFKRLPLRMPSALAGAETLLTHLVMRTLASRYSALVSLTSSFAFNHTRTPTFYHVTVPNRYAVLKLSARGGSSTGGLAGLRRVLHETAVRKFDSPSGRRQVTCASLHCLRLTKQLFPQIEATILYPPVDLKSFRPGQKKKRQIVSVGRFSPAKRQLELIGLAKCLPEFEFKLVGPAGSGSYFESCNNAVRHQSLTHVELMDSAPFSKLQQVLQESLIYVHLFPREPFGMTTAEAIAAGCVPLVPDSWGNREIVIIKELRYGEIGEIPDKIRQIANSRSRALEWVRKLQFHVKSFSEESFKRQFKALIERLLGADR